MYKTLKATLLLMLFSLSCITEKVETITEYSYIDVNDTESPEQYEVIKYVCSDGYITDDPSNCSIQQPVVVEVLKFVCFDGSVVDDLHSCEPYLIESDTLQSTTSTTSTTTSFAADAGCSKLGCPPWAKFVGSKSSDKYHTCDCKYAQKIKPENLVCFRSREEAESEGRISCSLCSP